MKKLISSTTIGLLYLVTAILAQTPAHKEWPAAYVHPDLPIYQAGKFKGWNQWDKSNEYSLFMIIEETNQTDLDEYILQLKAAGFETHDGSTYHKDLFDVGLQFNNPTILQISSSKITSLVWPKKWLEGVPEQKRGTLTNMIEPSEEMPGYVQLYYINLPRQDLDIWLQELKKAGFSIEGNSASKSNMSLSGKTYRSLDIQVEDNGTDEWMIDFNYSDE